MVLLTCIRSYSEECLIFGLFSVKDMGQTSRVLHNPWTYCLGLAEVDQPVICLLGSVT